MDILYTAVSTRKRYDLGADSNTTRTKSCPIYVQQMRKKSVDISTRSRAQLLR